MFKIFFAALLALCALGAPTVAGAAGEGAAKKMSPDEFLATLHFQQGRILLPGGIAILNLPDTFRYLKPDDAERLLVDAWGNPPGTGSLGMIFPADISPVSENGWGVVVTFDQDGHVVDEDADRIKYDELLTTMQEAVQANNVDRGKQGYAPMKLVGWAEKPSYDKTTHKLYWAKELGVDGTRENSLNYNIRVLGRDGVLVLNAVADMHQIGAIKSQMQRVNAFTEFTPGNRYSDFDSQTDKVAEYGIAALVAGGLAAKLGFFGKLFAFVLMFKKVLLVGVAAVGTGLFKLFGRKSKIDQGKE